MNIKKHTSSLIIIVFFAFFLKSIVYPFTSQKIIRKPNFSKIRILVASGKKSILIKYISPYHATIYEDNKNIFTARKKNILLKFKKNKINISNHTLHSKNITVRLSGKKSYFLIKKKKFYNQIKVTFDSKKFYIIYEIPLERYLSRVVYTEMPKDSPQEALKAQAIVSRTYSCYNILERRMLPYDLTLEAQAFGKYQGIIKPVIDTKGIIITDKGRIIPAFFHTNCGGFTEYPVNIWRTYYHYSKIIKCPFCRYSKNYKWKVKLSYKEIEKRLRKKGYNVKNIKSIFVYAANPKTHRATKVIIKCKNKKTIISANTFRLAVSPSKLKSTFFTIRNEKNYAVFIGRGYGHGAGMCQDGAREMAKQGYKAQEIIKFYFPGTRLEKIY